MSSFFTRLARLSVRPLLLPGANARGTERAHLHLDRLLRGVERGRHSTLHPARGAALPLAPGSARTRHAAPAGLRGGAGGADQHHVQPGTAQQFRATAFAVLNVVTALLTVGLGLYAVCVALDMGVAGLFAGALAAVLLMLPVRLYAIRNLLRPAFSPRLLRGLLAFGVPLVPMFAGVLGVRQLARCCPPPPRPSATTCACSSRGRTRARRWAGRGASTWRSTTPTRLFGTCSAASTDTLPASLLT
jgi:hypothetical protein